VRETLHGLAITLVEGGEKLPIPRLEELESGLVRENEQDPTPALT